MSWYALENLEEALQDSKDLLIPFDFHQWMRLAVIILLTGYVAAPAFTSMPFPSTNSDFETGTETGLSEYSSHISFEASSIQAPQEFNNFDLAFGFIGLAILAGIVSLIIFLTYVTSVFEFVMYRSLVDRDVKISRAREYLFEGLQFFIFRWATTTIILLALLGGLTAFAITRPSLTFTGVLTGLTISGVTVLFIAAVLALDWIVFNFALPDMIKQENNLAGAFSRAWKNVNSNLRQVALFWLVKLILGVVIGAGIVAVLVPMLLTLLVPFAITGYILDIITPLLVIPVVLTYLILAGAISLFVAVPVRVYMYYYVLEMYEDIF